MSSHKFKCLVIKSKNEKNGVLNKKLKLKFYLINSYLNVKNASPKFVALNFKIYCVTIQEKSLATSVLSSQND
jgi:hypothetical protein